MGKIPILTHIFQMGGFNHQPLFQWNVIFVFFWVAQVTSVWMPSPSHATVVTAPWWLWRLQCFEARCREGLFLGDCVWEAWGNLTKDWRGITTIHPSSPLKKSYDWNENKGLNQVFCLPKPSWGGVSKELELGRCFFLLEGVKNDYSWWQICIVYIIYMVYIYIWVFPKIRVSPKWMVYNGKP